MYTILAFVMEEVNTSVRFLAVRIGHCVWAIVWPGNQRAIGSGRSQIQGVARDSPLVSLVIGAPFSAFPPALVTGQGAAAMDGRGEVEGSPTAVG